MYLSKFLPNINVSHRELSKISGLAFVMNFEIPAVILTRHRGTARQVQPLIGRLWFEMDSGVTCQAIWGEIGIKRLINVPSTTCDMFLLEFVRLRMQNIILSDISRSGSLHRFKCQKKQVCA